jgi:arylsulfatase A-like enzyme
MLETEIPPFFTTDLIDQGYTSFLLSVWNTDYNGVSLRSFEQSVRPAARDRVDLKPFAHDADQAMVERALPALRDLRNRARSQPAGERGWLFYLHLTEPHFPWIRRDNAVDFGDAPEDRYDHAVSYSDRAVGQLLDYLKAEGLYDESVIVLMSDHGTGLMEHGRYAGFFCYEEQIRVPLLIKIPGVAPRRVREAVSLVDVAPTLLNLFQRGVPNRFHGVSLLPLLTGRAATSGRKTLFNLCAFNDAYALIHEGRWKLIFHRQEGYRQLFDLAHDPRERNNLIGQDPARDRELVGLLEAFLRNGRGTYNNPYHFKRYTPEH